MFRNVTIALVVAVAAAAGMWLTTQNTPTRAVTEIGTGFGAAVAQEADAALPAVPEMVLGQAEAPVTIVEYASFTCPHCQNWHANVFERLKADYIDTGKVRFVYREVYFDKFGLMAAQIARCGGEMRYFGIADLIYDTQRDWIGDGQEATITENLRKLGLKAGIAPDALDACLADEAMKRALVTAFQTNARADQIESTPTFIINGEKHAGDMAYEDFAKLIDAALAG
jgi:protein-disulfide isomerase